MLIALTDCVQCHRHGDGLKDQFVDGKFSLRRGGSGFAGTLRYRRLWIRLPGPLVAPRLEQVRNTGRVPVKHVPAEGCQLLPRWW